METFREFYSKNRKEKYLANKKELYETAQDILDNISNALTKALKLKIKNYNDRHYLNKKVKYICQKIVKGNSTFRTIFIKDTTKQGFGEKNQSSYMLEHYNLNLVKPLNHQQYCQNGKFYSKKQGEHGCKSIDFVLPGKDNIFIHNKHTTTSGGGQTNNIKDLVQLINECNKMEKYKQICIISGDNYNPKKIKVLETLIGSRGIIINLDNPRPKQEIEDFIN